MNKGGWEAYSGGCSSLGLGGSLLLGGLLQTVVVSGAV